MKTDDVSYLGIWFISVTTPVLPAAKIHSTSKVIIFSCCMFALSILQQNTRPAASLTPKQFFNMCGWIYANSYQQSNFFQLLGISGHYVYILYYFYIIVYFNTMCYFSSCMRFYEQGSPCDRNLLISSY